MSQLTQEYFDEKLGKLATKEDLGPLATKTDLLATKKDLMAQTEQLARMTKAGFDGVDEKLADIVDILDVRSRMHTLEQQMQEIRQALNLKS